MVFRFQYQYQSVRTFPERQRSTYSILGKEVLRYPDMECRELISALANRYGMPDRMITVGNGATEIMYTLLRVLLPGKVYVPAPSFSEYRLSAESVNAKVEGNTVVCKTDFKIPVEFLQR